MGFLLGGRESLSFRNRSNIFGKAPLGIGSSLFLPSCINKGNKVLVEGKDIDQVLSPTFVQSNRLDLC